MNYNSYSVILSTLKLQGSLTRPQIWDLVRPTNLYQSTLTFKSHLDTLIDTKRVVRVSELQFDAKQNKMVKNLFKYTFAADHERNVLPEELLSTVKKSLVQTMEKQRLAAIEATREADQKAKAEEVKLAKQKVNKQLDLKKKEDNEKLRVKQAMEKSSKLYKN
eukprot:gene3793-4374_t